MQVIGNSDGKQNSPPADGETDMFKASFTNLQYVELENSTKTVNQINDIDAFKKTLVTMPVTKTGTYSLTWNN